MHIIDRENINLKDKVINTWNAAELKDKELIDFVIIINIKYGK